MSELAVLVCHGFTAAPRTVEYIAPYLERAGLPYSIPILRGHATKYTDLEGVRWTDWVADGLAAFDSLRAQHARVAVVGHSMGALVAAQIAAERTVDSLTLVAPALKFANPLSRFVGLLAPVIKVWKGDGPNLFDADLLAQVKRDPVTYDRFPTAAFGELYTLAGLTPKVLERVTARALVIHSLQDEVIPPKAGEIALEHLGSKDKRVKWMERSRHEMFWDGERGALCEEIVRFVLQRDGLEKKTVQTSG